MQIKLIAYNSTTYNKYQFELDAINYPLAMEINNVYWEIAKSFGVV